MSFDRKLKVSIWEGFFFNLMVGSGETLLPALLLALGFSQASAGMVVVVPHIIGATVQLFSRFGVEWLGSRKRFVILCALIQSVSLYVLAFCAGTQSGTLLILYGLSAFYWSAGLSAGPAWNAWVGSLVPRSQRLAFFSSRNRIMEIATLSALLGSGIFLQLRPGLHSFAFLLAIAGSFRLISSILFVFHEDRNVSTAQSKPFSMPQAMGWLKSKTIAPIIGFLFLTYFAVYISAPFFNPYKLAVLKLNYLQYVILLAAVLASRFVSYTFLPRLAQARGVHFLLAMGSIGIIPVPALFPLSSDFYYLFVLQCASGFAWASFELGLALILLEHHNENERSRILTTVNFFQSLAMLLGSSVGAVLIRRMEQPAESYALIFNMSSLARFSPLILLPWVLRVEVTPRRVFMRVLGIRPGGAMVVKPIVQTTELKSERPSE